MPKSEDGSFEAWVLFARVPKGLAEAFPALVDGGVLAVLPRAGDKLRVESALLALMQAFVLTDAPDRLACARPKSELALPHWNRAGRHCELEVTGLPVLVAALATVWAIGDEVIYDPEPWLPGTASTTER